MFTVLPSFCRAAPPWFEAIICCGVWRCWYLVWWLPQPCSVTSFSFIAASVAVRFCSMLVCWRKKSMVALCHHFKEQLFTRLLMERFKKKLFCSLDMKMVVKSVTGTGLPLPWESGQREIFIPFKPWGSAPSEGFFIDILFTAVCAVQEEAVIPQNSSQTAQH